jgi:Ca2+:H+ antiporter
MMPESNSIGNGEAYHEGQRTTTAGRPMHGSLPEPEAVREHAAMAERRTPSNIFQEVKQSGELIFASRLTWLLIAGPVALAGSATEKLPDFLCFAFAGLALIPCAERLSFVTEQVAAHTNGTIGALLNASFGNAPELLISSAALRAGFYRIVQLAMLGSILCNLLLVFGMSCLVGGLRWQVQDIRIVSGSVPIAFLFMSTAGVAFPAAIKISGQIADLDGDGDIARELIGISRLNALFLMLAYMCYLFFQLGTHKDEFDDSTGQKGTYSQECDSPRVGEWRKRKARRNVFCRRFYSRGRSGIFQAISMDERPRDGGLSDLELSPMGEPPFRNEYERNMPQDRSGLNHSHLVEDSLDEVFDGKANDDEEEEFMTFRTGIVWLFIITVCISALSDILVDTIDSFAEEAHLSEVFTSAIVLPFFSNIAEQVSAVLFAYRNEMDLCIGVTVGSAVQIATMVLPGSVLVGWAIDRSMSMYVRGYETCCLIFGVLLVAAVLQGGTTNWLSGVLFVTTYIMMAVGFWYHELEVLDVDAEIYWRSHNGTAAING